MSTLKADPEQRSNVVSLAFRKVVRTSEVKHPFNKVGEPCSRLMYWATCIHLKILENCCLITISVKFWMRSCIATFGGSTLVTTTFKDLPN